ncbi:MAG: hypothetical protein JRN35_06325 [Nitrososphaerota archaeon]|nr:hypothetical protein [Nitrososphaerota archaeon]
MPHWKVVAGSRHYEMAIVTVDKVVLIVVVTVIVIVLAYVFRFGRFSRSKQTGTASGKGRQSL